MEKLQSKDIEWQEGDVVAAVEIGKNEVCLQFSFEPTKHASVLGDFFDFNGHKFNREYFYIVTREVEPVKTVFDAVCALHGDLHSAGYTPNVDTHLIYNKAANKYLAIDGLPILFSSALICTIGEFNHYMDNDLALYANKTTPTEPMYYHIYKIAFADMERQKEEQTTEEVLHGLFDKSRSPWVNLANLCGKMAKEYPVEAFAEGEPVKPWREIADAYSQRKPTYTQAMKDAGELPSVGMSAIAVSESTSWGVVEVVYINKDQFVCTDNKGDVLIHYPSEGESFDVIDTRTPEQKQIEEAAHFIDINHGASSSFIAKEMQKSGLLAEIKSLFVVGGS